MEKFGEDPPLGGVFASPTDQTDRVNDVTSQNRDENPDDDLGPPGSPVEPRH